LFHAGGLLLKCLRLFKKVYICIDALDECAEKCRYWLLQEIGILSSTEELKDSLRVFITGRPHVADDIKLHVKGPDLHTTTLEARKEDILKFLNYRIQMDKMGLQMSAEFTAEIVSKIVEAADGMLVTQFFLSIITLGG
jgi:hypothetical protein